MPSGCVTGRGVWMFSLPSWARLLVTLASLALTAWLLLMYRTWILAAYLVMAVAAFTRRARKEEEALEAAFGTAWRDYARRVGRWIPVRWRP